MNSEIFLILSVHLKFLLVIYYANLNLLHYKQCLKYSYIIKILENWIGD